MAGVFCDSFAFYDTAGIGKRYSTVGGSIQTNPAHIRTGPRSLQIQAGDAPTVLNFTLPADVTQTYCFAGQYYNFAVGLAYQTGALNGLVFDLQRNLTISPTPARDLLSVRINGDGSLSLLTAGVTELARSAAGVLTAGAFYYITLTADIGGFSESTFAVVNVTTAGGVTTDVISISSFVLADQFIDSILFGGPAGPDHAWVNDFYVQDLSDGSTAPFAPNIYATVPNADGTALTVWDFITIGSWQPVGGSHFGLVNSVPEDESQGIQFLESPRYAPDPPFFIITVAETYLYNCAVLPNATYVQGIQTTFLWEYQTSILGVDAVQVVALFQNDTGLLSTVQRGVASKPGMPYVFIPTPSDFDPWTGLAWLTTDWKTGLRQAGPSNITPQ